MFCERCNSDRGMVLVKDPYLDKHRCNDCEGIYIKKTQFKKLIKEVSGSDLNLFPEPRNEDSHPTIHCPECISVEMLKKTISEFSETIFDFCPQCEGVFLDKNEFTEMNLSAKETMPINPEHLGVFNEHETEESIAEGLAHGVAHGVDGGRDTCYSYYFIRFSICFKENLGLGLNMFAEKWTDKLAKIIGFSRKQDIQIGDKKIDSQFIIQGYHKDDVILLLSDSKVRSAIHDLKKKVAGQPILKGNFRISDSKVTYSEGPYDHPIKFINTVNPEMAKTTLMNVVEAFENYYTLGK